MHVITEKEYNIHYYEVDCNKRVLVTSLINYLGDIAIKQTEELDMDLEFLQDKKLAWVIYKWDINMYEYPTYNDKIIVRTYAYGLKKFYAYRKYEIINDKGELIGKADSVWFLINTEKRKPMSIPQYMYRAYGIEKGENKSFKISKMNKLDKIDIETKFKVRYSDIDINNHVNNAKYISWALESIPKDIIEGKRLSNMKVTYIKEVEYEQNIKVKTQICNKNENNKLIFIHKIQDKSDKELTFLQTEWQ